MNQSGRQAYSRVYRWILYSTLLLLDVLPLAYVVLGSLRRIDPFAASAAFAGANNFKALVADPRFGQSILASIAYAVPTVVVQFAIAVPLAAFAGRRILSSRWLRVGAMAPYLIPPVALVLVAQFFTDPYAGPVASCVRWLGGAAIDFRGPSAAPFVIVVLSAFEAIPFVFLLLAVDVLAVPLELREVAELAGAGLCWKFRTMLWPAMRNTCFTLAGLRFVFTFIRFDIPWLVYGQRHENSWTDTVSIISYRAAFEWLSFGQAYAFSIAIVIGAAAAWLAFRATRQQSAPAEGRHSR